MKPSGERTKRPETKFKSSCRQDLTLENNDLDDREPPQTTSKRSFPGRAAGYSPLQRVTDSETKDRYKMADYIYMCVYIYIYIIFYFRFLAL